VVIRKPVTAGDEVDRYLTSRGVALPVYPKVLRFHPALGYYQKDADGKSHKVAEYPAMLACIQGEDGHAVTLHRTYLQDGAKLAMPDAKKVLSSGINGAAVRLFEATEDLGISEGIEKSIALYLATGRPFWAGLNAGNLEKLWIRFAPDPLRQFLHALGGRFVGPDWHHHWHHPQATLDITQCRVEIDAEDCLQQLEAAAWAATATVIVSFTELVGVLEAIPAAARGAGEIAPLEDAFIDTEGR
jgi:hypothetical protein